MALEIYMTLLSVLLYKEVPEVLGEKTHNKSKEQRLYYSKCKAQTV